jgi:phage terminase small subunit
VANLKLTVKQDKFVKAYLLNGGNATQAAIKAGYSKSAARIIGAQNLTKTNIKQRLSEYQKKSDQDFALSKSEKLNYLELIMKAAMLKDSDKGMINMVSAIAAIKEHNAMQGHNAPTETVSNINATTSLVEILTGGSKR